MRVFPRLLLCLLVSLTLRAHGDLTNATDVLAFAAQMTASYESLTGAYVHSMAGTGDTARTTGTVQFQKPARMRMDVTIPMLGVQQQLLAVMSDDRVMWQEVTIGDQKNVMKMDFSIIPSNHPVAAMIRDPFADIDPQRLVTKLRTHYDVALLGLEPGQDQPRYVLEGTRRADVKLPAAMAGIQQTLGKLRAHIGQRDGFIHKLEQFEASDSQVVMTMEFQNVRFNVPLPESTFRYAPPTGAHVMDLTQMLLQMGRKSSPASR